MDYEHSVRSGWETLRDLVVAFCIIGLVAWVVLTPKHKETPEQACKKIGGVVAYTALKNEKICIKGGVHG